ncbi:type II secretion system protein, partial [bacterium]|nr:type II secretion system protein [bacterium]
KLSRSKAFGIFGCLKTFIYNLFKGEPSRVNSEQSRQFTHNSSLSTVRSHAFTLAETLIVMGIIGVVAALTIPNVNKNTGEAEKVARFKKVYAELNEALDRATAVYGPVKTWYDNMPECEDSDSCYKYAKKFTDRLTEFMKVTKACRDSDEGCWCSNSGYSSCVIFANGASIEYWDTRSDCDFYVDIDGPKKGKQTFGIDVFFLGGCSDNFINGMTPYLNSYEEFMSEMNYNHGDCHNYCGQWILDNGNMDYLNIDSQGRCKNDTSKVLGYGEGKVQSCK